MMNIKEYWARLVSAGLAPDWKNVWAYWDDNGYRIQNPIDISNHYALYTPLPICIKSDETIQLRKDGIDQYKLEWREPTEQDIGKECWFSEDGFKTFYYGKLGQIEDESGFVEIGGKFIDEDGKDYEYCYLAINGRTAPMVEDACNKGVKNG
jgi:hypothetical protein